MMFILCLFAAALAAALANADGGLRDGDRVHMETGLFDSRDDFSRVGYAAGTKEHAVVFAVKQRNLDQLEDLLFEVSDPTNAKYGAHLNRMEVADLTSNPAATLSVSNFLTTCVGVQVDRAAHYSLPAELAQHVSAVFNTVQLPARIAKRAVRLRADAEVTGTVTPSFLNTYYDITSNTGSTQASQSAFGTIEQYFSPADLSQFQSTYGIPQQTADDIGGHASDSKCVEDANNCFEANLGK
jgi:hypothetical protein